MLLPWKRRSCYILVSTLSLVVIIVFIWYTHTRFSRVKDSVYQAYKHWQLSPVIWTPENTKGEVWPLPQFVAYQQSFVRLDPSDFNIKATKHTCGILDRAIERYTDVIKKTNDLVYWNDGECRLQRIADIELQLENSCETWPHLYMDESYEIHVNTVGFEDRAVVRSNSIWGLLRGLETFSQLVTVAPEPGCLLVNSTDISDHPSYSHRGLLLDTTRHYMPLHTIHHILSGMEMNKMNVLHWHIVDDQSFPYQSSSFPDLIKGAYDPLRFIYTHENIRGVIEYARDRGIRVIPEFDSPGHTQSWGKGVDKLLTPCLTNSTLDGTYGPVDPSRTETFQFMKTLLEEVKSVFQDEYVHIGGDEVDYTCWQSNPAVNKFMEQHGIIGFKNLEGYYIKRILDILNTINVKGIVWQEVFEHNPDLKDDFIVQIWIGNRTEHLRNVTSHGKLALNSEGWYLDHIARQWEDFYVVYPRDFNESRAQQSLVVGGEACMWAEMVDESNVVSRIFPRASAVAERLWASEDTRDVDAARRRLNEHVCRMKRRGVAAQPANGPGFCPY